MYKKAQAAMEFLMTYGWAILVVLVAIGALAYFGVLNPGKYLPSSCIVTPGIGCQDHQIMADGSGVLILTNGMGSTLQYVNVSIDGKWGKDSCEGTFPDGQDCTFTWIASGGNDLGTLTAGTKYKADINFSYAAGLNGINHSKIGSLTTNVEG